MSGPVTRFHLEWEAATMPRLFPFMKGDLDIYPLTSTETQLDFSGIYEPPLGAVGRGLGVAAYLAPGSRDAIVVRLHCVVL